MVPGASLVEAPELSSSGEGLTALLHVGSWFPDQGFSLNLSLLHWKADLNHCTTREVLRLAVSTGASAISLTFGLFGRVFTALFLSFVCKKQS